MRVLTVISGLVMAICGAFCFAFSGNLFSSVAFVIGVTMVISGGCSIGAYIISGKGHNRLTETSLVEGLVTLLYGVAVLNNQVTDTFLTMFFGTWLTVCGITRVSQSFYVSRFNPKDWAKIIPLAAMASMFGVVMMMPKLVVAVSPLMLVGGAFIFVGLSMLTYAMYMKRRSSNSEGEIKAKERAEAKKAVAKAERQERDRLRSLSKKERDEELARQRAEKEEQEKAKKAAIAAQKEARRQAARPENERTMEISPEEVEEINIKVDDKIVGVDSNNPMAAIWATMAKEDGMDVTINKVAKKDKDKTAEMPTIADEPQIRPVWQRPTDIPKVKKEKSIVKDDTLSSIEFKAVNLEEIESARPAVEFEKIKLPELKLASDDQSADRREVLKEISNTILKKEEVDYTPISLEDLVAEPLVKPYDPEESKRFTQTLNFGWLDEQLEEKKK